jgi:NlpC/P60 family putative phage cell wall peptidase
MTSTISRDTIVAIARSWAGTPYRHRQSSKGNGTDCLGLVRGIWRELYDQEPETPPPYARDWAEALGRDTLIDAARRHLVEIDKAELRPGDVLVFRYRKNCPAKHVGIYLHPRRLLHAMEGLPVSEVRLSPWWFRKLDSAFAFPGLPPDAPLSLDNALSTISL